MARMDTLMLFMQARKLLGDDYKLWKPKDFGPAAELVVESEPSYTYSKIDRQEAVFTLVAHMYDMYNQAHRYR
jgi:hypothetical protein